MSHEDTVALPQREEPRVLLTPQQFIGRLLITLTEVIRATNRPLPRRDFLETVSRAWRAIYSAQPCDANDARIVAEAMLHSTLALLDKLPSAASGQFMVPIHDLIPQTTITDVVMPFYHTSHIQVRGLCEDIRAKFRAGAALAAENQPTKKEQIWPDEYSGDLPPHKLYLIPELAALFEYKVPLRIEDTVRYQHTWIMGRNGTGKSTLICNLIDYDLDRVAKGEASLIIMDPKAEKGLAQNVAKLPQFAPGGALHGRLVYISPTEPVALNPFRLRSRREKHINAALDILEYSFGAVFDSGTTSLQAGAARHILRLLLEIADANLQTFHDLLAKPDEYLLYADEIARLPPPSQDFFNDSFAKMHAPTRTGIIDRLSILREQRAIREMLSSTEQKFDLAHLLQKGRVVCIDADRSELVSDERLAVFGRLFIAAVLQATLERFGVDEDKLVPTSFILDEAHDFIGHDRRIKQLLYQSRAQCVGLVVAHHDTNQISDQVAAALNNSGTTIQCNKKGQAPITIREHDKTYLVTARNLHYQHAKKMSAAHWQQVLAENRKAYGLDDGTIELPTTPQPVVDTPDAVTDFKV
jgi:hypothetical protein